MSILQISHDLSLQLSYRPNTGCPGALTRISSSRSLDTDCIRIKIGLALGSVPFLLREHLSYGHLAIFALAGYPYSLKLLWSPIVDSCFFENIGRRKSWIIPMQLVIGTLLLWIANNVQVLLDTVSTSYYEPE